MERSGTQLRSAGIVRSGTITTTFKKPNDKNTIGAQPNDKNYVRLCFLQTVAVSRLSHVDFGIFSVRFTVISSGGF